MGIFSELFISSLVPIRPKLEVKRHKLTKAEQSPAGVATSTLVAQKITTVRDFQPAVLIELLPPSSNCNRLQLLTLPACGQLTRAGDLITSISLVRTQQYTTDSKKRLTKVERSQIIIENPLNEIIIGLLLVFLFLFFFFVKLKLFKFKDLNQAHLGENLYGMSYRNSCRLKIPFGIL